MASNNSICQLLERNLDIFKDKEVLLVGDILDPMLLALVKDAKKATIICDNYVVCQKMAAMIGLSLDNRLNQKLSYKHVTIFFARIEQTLAKLDKVDNLVLLLSKNKLQTLKLLSLLKGTLKESSFIYTAGANDGGAKSADSILSKIGHCKKVDLARKCTLFRASFDNDYELYSGCSDLKLSLLGHNLCLKQDPIVFSTGKLDVGTKLLLECLEDLTPQGRALDLGCGCGVVGIFLSKLGFKNVTACDISASALNLAYENARDNDCSDISYVPSDMLSEVGSFDYIVVNPPFHVGINTDTAPTINMIIDAPNHLNDEGKLYMVANAHLHYEKYLEENFSKVSVLKKTNTFVVYLAQK